MQKSKSAKLLPGEVEDKALDVLRAHGIQSVPIDPVSIANREGIKVHNAKFSDSNLSGMVAKRGSEMTLLINQSDPPFRKRFTIAHELGHLYLHLQNDGQFIDTQVDLFRESGESHDALTPERLMEIQANQFAASLLMPKPLVVEYFHKVPRVADLAKLFNVSEEAMAIRLNRLGLL